MFVSLWVGYMNRVYFSRVRSDRDDVQQVGTNLMAKMSVKYIKEEMKALVDMLFGVWWLDMGLRYVGLPGVKQGLKAMGADSTTNIHTICIQKDVSSLI